MWWIVLLLFGCVTEPAPVPGAPEAPKQAKTKAKTGKKPPTGGAKKMPPTARKKPAPKKKFGFAGPVAGELSFETVEEKTKATLKMTWEGGDATALLGVTPGTCSEGEVQALPDGDEALWWAVCEAADKKAEFAVGQKANTLWVKRALHGEEGLGDWKNVRNLDLVEGTVLSKK